jgi:hypothetical protein
MQNGYLRVFLGSETAKNLMLGLKTRLFAALRHNSNLRGNWKDVSQLILVV